jgi:hypothetical protein
MIRSFACHTRPLFAVLGLAAALSAGSAQAAPTDMAPRGGPHAALACPPTVGGEVNTLCAPRPAPDPYPDQPWRRRLKD